MARLPEGQKPTPRPDRLKTYREGLVARGGHRLIADIEKPANDALRQIMERVSPVLSQKDAVSEALISYAAQKPKRAR